MLGLQPALSVLGGAPPEKLTEGQPAGKETDRIGSVLRAWPVDRAHPDSGAAAQGVERERTPVFQPVPKKSPAGEAAQAAARERASLLEAVAKLRSKASAGPQGVERKRPPAFEAAPKPKLQAGANGQAAEQERASLLEAVAKLKSKASAAPQAAERKRTPASEPAPIPKSQADVAPQAAEPVCAPAFQPVSKPEPQAKPAVETAPRSEIRNVHRNPRNRSARRRPNGRVRPAHRPPTTGAASLRRRARPRRRTPIITRSCRSAPTPIPRRFTESTASWRRAFIRTIRPPAIWSASSGCARRTGRSSIRPCARSTTLPGRTARSKRFPSSGKVLCGRS